MNKRIVTFRLESELADRLDQYARTHGWVQTQEGLRGGNHKGKDTGRTALLTHVIEALVENRCTIHEPGPSPFIEESVLRGQTPENPVYISSY